MWPYLVIGRDVAIEDPGGEPVALREHEKGEAKNLAKEYGRGEDCSDYFTHEIITKD